MNFVLDASTMLGWYFEDERKGAEPLLRELARSRAVVPAHWQAELANGVVIGERRGRSNLSQIGALLALIDSFEIEVDGDGNDEALDRILPLARAHKLTVYDALYLELAERRGLPLATLDGPLSRAAQSVGIEVLR